MNAKDAMSAPVVSERPGTPVKELAGLLLATRIGAVPVTDTVEKIA